MIGVHTLYVYNKWSENGMGIVSRHYLLIWTSELSVKNIIGSYEPNSIDEFLKVLLGMDIKYEEMEPVSLDNIRHMKA